MSSMICYWKDEQKQRIYLFYMIKKQNRMFMTSSMSVLKYKLYLPSTVFIAQVLVQTTETNNSDKLLRIPTGKRETSCPSIDYK